MQVIEIKPWIGNKTAKRSEKRFDAILTKSFFLKPCPFCGGKAGLEHTWTAHYWIECETCEAEVPGTWSGNASSETGHRRAAESAMNAWNKRA